MEKSPTRMVTCRALEQTILDKFVSQILPSRIPFGKPRKDPCAAVPRFARPEPRSVTSAVFLQSDHCDCSGTMPKQGRKRPDRRTLLDIHGNRSRPAGKRERESHADVAQAGSCSHETATSVPCGNSNPVAPYLLAGRQSDGWR